MTLDHHCEYRLLFWATTISAAVLEMSVTQKLRAPVNSSEQGAAAAFLNQWMDRGMAGQLAGQRVAGEADINSSDFSLLPGFSPFL